MDATKNEIKLKSNTYVYFLDTDAKMLDNLIDS